MLDFMQNASVVLSNMIEKDVGSVIGVLVNVIAFIMNIIYNMISTLTEKHSLGISIILMTLVLRLVMLPQGVSQQKSQIKMRKVQPEIDKIKKKYGSSKDPEVQRKISMETQAVYQKHKINMLAGCLPLLITLPIFMALSDLMRRLFIYVDKIHDLYMAICNKLYEIPNIAAEGSALWNICFPMVPNDMTVDIRVADDLIRFIDKFTPENWGVIREQITDPGVLQGFNDLMVRHDNIQTFLGVNLVNTVRLSWPPELPMIMPVITAGTSFLQSYFANKLMSSTSSDQATKANQRIMLIVMPIMMFFFTLNVSAGVGVYWIALNVFALIQQIVLAKLITDPALKDGDIVGKAKEKTV